MMLIALRVAAKLLCFLAICVLIGYMCDLFRFNRILRAVTPPHAHPIYCRWPPVNLHEIRTANNTYNITICAQPHPNASTFSSSITYPIKSIFNTTTDDRWVSFEELGESPRSMWELVMYPNIYRTYPQDVPIRDIVKAIKSGSLVSATPDYNYPIRILKTSNSVCSDNTTHDLVMVVKSGILNWERRRLFRAFIRREKKLNPHTQVGVVFSLGMPRQYGGRKFDRDGHEMVLEGPAGDLMDEYNGRSNEVMQKIEEEMRMHDDIVLADYEDTYYNLTWKTVTNLRWISAFCDKRRNDVFVLIDDDHRMNISMLMEFLASVPRGKKRTSFFGRIAVGDYANRSPRNKLYLSYREVPWDLMRPYPRGFCQLVGADIVDDMAIGSAYTRYPYVHEDVYLGLLAFKLGIPLQHVNTMFDHKELGNPELKSLPFMVAESSYWKMT